MPNRILNGNLAGGSNRDGVVQRLRDNQDDLYIMSMPPTDIALEDQESA